MIYKIALLFSLIISLKAQAFNKDFSTINDRVPLEFTMLFNSLKLEIKTPSDKIKMIGLCKEINDNLGFLKKEHIFLLLKTEVIKGTLEYKFKRVRRLDMNSALLGRMEADLKNQNQKLNAFSQWIWQSIIAELRHRQDMGLVGEANFNALLFDGAKKQNAIRFQRYLQYLMPWVDQMTSLDSASFNDVSTEVSWSILNRINERSIIFKRYSSTSLGDSQVVLINIPQELLELKPDEIKAMQNNQTPLTLREQSKKEKSEAAEEVDRVSPLDMSPLSEDLARELDGKVPDSSKAP